MLLADKGFFLRPAESEDPAGTRGFAQVSMPERKRRVGKIDTFVESLTASSVGIVSADRDGSLRYSLTR